jgi:hypothetical protein
VPEGPQISTRIPLCSGKSRQNVTPSSNAIAPISILQGITGSQPSSGSFVGSAVGIIVGVPVEREIVGLDVGKRVEGLKVGSCVGLFVGHGPHSPTSRAFCTRPMAALCEVKRKLVRAARDSMELSDSRSTYVNKE